MMVISAIKRVFLLGAILCTGCQFPPEEVDSIREQLQVQLTRGQVYVMHSDNVLSYVIRNSEFNSVSEEERGKLVSSVEKQTLVFLAKYQNYKYIRIYFLGHGTAGIKSPYMCRTTFNACVQSAGKGEP